MTAANTWIKEGLEYNVKSLVDNPDEVLIKIVEGPQTTVFEVYVIKADVGKVIGKQGKTASALRTLLNSWAARCKIRAVMEIME
jgi:predicted RNA-binding protein YlqC (UPF0109 family)